MLLFAFVSPIVLGCLAFGCLSSLDSLHLPPFAYCVCLAFAAVFPSLSASLSLTLCSHGAFPNFCLFWQGTLWSSSCLPQLPIISSCLQGVFPWSPNCVPIVCCLPPSCVPVVFQISPGCGFPDMFPSFLQGFSTCCRIVFHLSPTCALPMVSRCGFTVVARCCFPDVPPQLPSRFLHLLSHYVSLVPQMWSPSCGRGFYTCCLLFSLFPRCGLPVVP